MKRKLIQQGNGGFTISIPKNWVLDNNLIKGDDLDVHLQENKLILSNSKLPTKTINATIENSCDKIIRNKLLNLYRKGVDKIKILNCNNAPLIQDIIFNYLPGFEIVDDTNHTIILENLVSDQLNTDKLFVKKQFLIIENIIKNLDKKSKESSINLFLKYNLICKRHISKKKVVTIKDLFLWQFLSQMAYLFKILNRFHKKLEIAGIKNTLKTKIIEKLYLKFNIIKKCYFTNKFENINLIYKKINPDLLDELKDDVDLLSEFLLTEKMIYLLLSPLQAYLEK